MKEYQQTLVLNKRKVYSDIQRKTGNRRTEYVINYTCIS